MRYRLFLFLMVLSPVLWAQEYTSYEKYREDQFYLGVTYNLLLNVPEEISQNNLSYGLQGGFIRDFPLNPKGTFAIGLGLGYAVNSYYTNLRAIEEADGIRYVYLEETEYRRNKLEIHQVELPLEFRWRNSTRTSYKFWRVYGGVKLGYVFGSRSKYVATDFKESFNNRDSENFRYGLMLNVGYNTFNIHVYYGLNPLFEDGVRGPEGQALDFYPLHLGLMFYIL